MVRVMEKPQNTSHPSPLEFWGSWERQVLCSCSGSAKEVQGSCTPFRTFHGTFQGAVPDG